MSWLWLGMGEGRVRATIRAEGLLGRLLGVRDVLGVAWGTTGRISAMGMSISVIGKVGKSDGNLRYRGGLEG